MSEIKTEKDKKVKERKGFPVTQLPGYNMHINGPNQSYVAYAESAATSEVNSDGEITDSKKNSKTITRTKLKEDDFIKVYLSDVAYLHRLQPNQQELLFYFLRKMNYDNLIVINKTIKEMISAESGKSFSSVENALTSYSKTGILIRNGRGVYTANPFLFGKGKFEKIHEIRTELTYTADGIKMNSLIKKGDKNED